MDIRLQTEPDLNDYHIYGFEWTKDYMKFYVDGVCYQTYDLNADYAADLPGMDGYREYIYLLINNELFTQNSDWKAYAGCEITDVILCPNILLTI